MRIKMLLKKQDGMALALVMIIFMVIAVLGSIIVTLSLAEVKQSVALDKDMRAYYQARSAADATTYWIRNELLDLYEIEYAYLQLDDAVEKIEGQTTFILANVTGNMAALEAAVSEYDDDAVISTKAAVIRKIALCLDAMSYIPEGVDAKLIGSLEPSTIAELDGYLDLITAEETGILKDAQNDHDAKETALDKVVKPTPGVTNSASLSSTGVITGVVAQGIKVQRQDTGGVQYIYTKATADVDGVRSSAVVRLNETALGDVASLFSDAIYAASDIKDIKGNSYEVKGRVSYGDICEGIKHDNINVGPEKNDGVVYPDWNPPGDLPAKKWPGKGGSNDKKPLALPGESGSYSGLTQADGYYSIEPKGKDVTLHFENLDLSEPSGIKVEGTGNVFIFIDAIADPKKIQLSINSKDAYTYLIFDVNVKEAVWTGNCKVDAFIYAPNAIVDVGGGTIVNGAIITNNYISSNGNFTVNYRPCNLKLHDYADNSEDGNGKQWLKEEQWPES